MRFEELYEQRQRRDRSSAADPRFTPHVSRFLEAMREPRWQTFSACVALLLFPVSFTNISYDSALYWQELSMTTVLARPPSPIRSGLVTPW